jgi:hypothetical protein
MLSCAYRKPIHGFSYFGGAICFQFIEEIYAFFCNYRAISQKIIKRARAKCVASALEIKRIIIKSAFERSSKVDYRW